MAFEIAGEVVGRLMRAKEVIGNVEGSLRRGGGRCEEGARDRATSTAGRRAGGLLAGSGERSGCLRLVPVSLTGFTLINQPHVLTLTGSLGATTGAERISDEVVFALPFASSHLHPIF